MENKTLFHTNILVCLIILIGFAITSVISYRANLGIYTSDVEQVSALTSEGIYNDIATIFSQPVSVSLTMANDSLLKRFLSQEREKIQDERYLEEMKDYLHAYREKYGYDSVFLVSTASNRYYHYEGLDRVLTKDNPENEWYYDFLQSEEEYSLNVDNDETTAANTITVFVNCKIKSENGQVLGIVGVGLQVDSLQALLKGYEDKYHLQAYLLDKNGTVEISSDKTGHEKLNFFDTVPYADRKGEILSPQEERQTFWYRNKQENGYVVSRYEENLKWYLVVENDTSLISQQLNIQLGRSVLIIAGIVFLVLFTITNVIKKYNSQIIKLTISQELEYQQLLRKTTEGLYENILEFDITHNRAGGESTKEYFKKLGISPDASYDEAFEVIAREQIKEEYQEEYLSTFFSQHVLESYRAGITNLSYDFMISESEEEKEYHWVRLSARIFFWNSDQSVRMISYRTNIDQQKKRELLLIETVQKDPMTGLYNKRASEERIETILQEANKNKAQHAFLIFDIDNFKTVNDTMGHSFGDHVICELAAEMKAQFRECDVVGRIGGDEFVVLIKNIESMNDLIQKLERLHDKLSMKDFGEGETQYISCSFGVSLFPKDALTYSELYEKADQALYYAKGHGKNSFSFFGELSGGRAFHVSQRDIEALINAASDGVAKFACTKPFTLLYFNQKCVELTGTPVEVLSTPGYDMLAHIDPDDRPVMLSALEGAREENRLFDLVVRIVHYDGHLVPVRIKGIFVSEQYDNQYPIFYAMYTKKTQ